MKHYSTQLNEFYLFILDSVQFLRLNTLQVHENKKKNFIILLILIDS
jgi:hypothetical protein